MTDKNKSYTLLVVDRSGSMQTIKTDTEGGIAFYFAEQREVDGEHNVTLVEFDSDYNVVYDNKPINDVPIYYLNPRGMTALYDAIGRSVTELGQALAKLPERKRPGSVNVVVLTDGLENSSREWTAQSIKNLIEKQQNVYSWNFTFMGANQDAVLTGSELGFLPQKSLTYVGQNVGQAFVSASIANNVYRSSTASGLSHSEAVIASAFTDTDREKAVASN